MSSPSNADNQNKDEDDNVVILPSAGLQNNGNFCYLNASIQCLRVLEPFVIFFRESDKNANIMIEIIKLFGATDVRQVKTNIKSFKTIAYHLDKYYSNNPDPTDPYINPDTSRGPVAMEDIYGKNPPSELAKCDDAKVDQIVNGIQRVQSNREISRQVMYNIIRKLALHLEKVYVYITVYSLLVHMEKSSSGKVGSIANPVEVISTLNVATRDTIEYENLCNGQQNDASELTVVLMDFLHESQAFPIDLSYPPEIISMSEDELKELDVKEQITAGIMRKIHASYSHNYTSLVNGMFFFSLKVLSCGTAGCDSQSLSYDTDNILQVPIPIEDIAHEIIAKSSPSLALDRVGTTANSIGNMDSRHLRQSKIRIADYCSMLNRRQLELKADPVSIYDCIDDYFKREIVDEYKCEKCKQANPKTTMCRALVNLPSVLIITLKRFRTIDNYGRRAKVYRRVTYPMILDVSKYCASSVTSGTYRLMAVNMHSGSVDGGHYTATTYNAEQDQWYLFNDIHVSKLNPVDVLNNINAYILYYKKI